MADENVRCMRCGATLEGNHVGKEVCYCPSCKDFVMRLADGERPIFEAREQLLANPPRGVSLRKTEEGEITIVLGVPWRRLLAVPIMAVAFVAVLSVTARIGVPGFGAPLVATLAFSASVVVTLWILSSLVARRIMLKRDSLVITSLWLGFIPIRRRTFARTGQTVMETFVRRGRDGCSIRTDVLWCNGTDCKLVWGGRKKLTGEYIESALGWEVGLEEFGTPYPCAVCGAEIPDRNFDMKKNRLACPNCGAVFTVPYASNYRSSVFHAKFAPEGVEEIRDGFVYRERRWWSGEAKRALAVVGILCATANVFEKPLGRVFDSAGQPWSAVLAISAVAAALLYLAWHILHGRFCIHRIVLNNGTATYFHGIGTHGKTETFRYHRHSVFCIRTHGGHDGTPSGKVPDAILTVAKESETLAERQYVLFEHLIPGFYGWALSRLYLAAAKIDPPEGSVPW